MHRPSGDAADALAPVRAAGEHERGAGCRMGGEGGEHGTLIVGGEVKEAVPGQKPVEFPPEPQMPHVGQHHVMVRQVPAKHLHHRPGPVDSGHLAPTCGEPERQRIARPAAHVQKPRPRHRGQKSLQRRPLEQRARALLGPRRPHRLVGRKDVVGVAHVRLAYARGVYRRMHALHDA